MTDSDSMTLAAWLWVAFITAGLFAGGFLLLRGLMMAALWVGGAL